MTSYESAFAQIDSRSKFLRALATTAEYPLATTSSAVTSVMTQADFTANTTVAESGGAVGDLYRDLGREVVIVSAYGAGALKLAVYRQVAVMSSATNEGVAGPGSPAEYPYVKVWDAAGAGVTVARTG
jgi:hypothetical protein